MRFTKSDYKKLIQNLLKHALEGAEELKWDEDEPLSWDDIESSIESTREMFVNNLVEGSGDWDDSYDRKRIDSAEEAYYASLTALGVRLPKPRWGDDPAEEPWDQHHWEDLLPLVDERIQKDLHMAGLEWFNFERRKTGGVMTEQELVRDLRRAKKAMTKSLG